MRLAKLLKEIRQSASRLADNPPVKAVDLRVETDLDLANLFERNFWTPPIHFETTEMRDAEPDEDDRMAAFKTLALMRRLDWGAMRQRIKAELKEHPQLSMAEMFEQQPPLGGVVEVLGYLQIAHDDGHDVDLLETETLHIPIDDYAEMFDDPEELRLGHAKVVGYESYDQGAILSRILVLEVPRVIFRAATSGIEC
jgi:hypothetical protein